MRFAVKVQICLELIWINNEWPYFTNTLSQISFKDWWASNIQNLGVILDFSAHLTTQSLIKGHRVAENK